MGAACSQPYKGNNVKCTNCGYNYKKVYGKTIKHKDITLNFCSLSCESNMYEYWKTIYD
jgi:hypothetical protein